MRFARAVIAALIALAFGAIPALAAQQVAPVARPAVLTSVKAAVGIAGRIAVRADLPNLRHRLRTIDGSAEPAVAELPLHLPRPNAVQPRGNEGAGSRNSTSFSRTMSSSCASKRPKPQRRCRPHQRPHRRGHRHHRQEELRRARIRGAWNGRRGTSAASAYEPPPRRDYELVLLKYADVSEVVGLLTDGLTVKSNDVFIPSEPQFGSNSLTGNNYTPQQVDAGAGRQRRAARPIGRRVDRHRPPAQRHLAQGLARADRADEGDDRGDRHSGRQRGARNAVRRADRARA